MEPIRYNDMEFNLVRNGDRWDLTCDRPDGTSALAGTGLFEGLAEGEAYARAAALVKTVFPVGIRSVGPDVAHPLTIGDLKIVGPDVGHPNFIYWNKDSVRCPRDL